MENIFIQIAAYKDPELIKTLDDCLQKSSFPEDCVSASAGRKLKQKAFHLMTKILDFK